MENFENVETEYNNIYNYVKNESEDINNMEQILKTFHKNISMLKDDIINIPTISDNKYDCLNQTLKNFTTVLQKHLNDFNDIIGSPLENFINNLKYATEKNLNQFKETINALYEEKDILLDKRDTYFNYIDITNKNDDTIQNDENILNLAKKENSEQLYKYEINKMKEIIAESNTKYTKIYQEINSINKSLNLTIKDYLIKFSKNILHISEAFNNFSKELIKRVNSINIVDNKDYSKKNILFTISEDELNFPKNNNEEEKKDDKDNNNNTIANNNTSNNSLNNIISETKNLFGFFRRKNTVMNENNTVEKENEAILQKKNIDKRISMAVQKRDEKQFLIDIIKIIIGEKELKIIEITDLTNVLTQNINEKDESKNFAYFFLNK